MTTETIVMHLSNAFTLIVLASLTMAVGLSILAGMVWIYLWIGRRLLVFIHKAYDEAMKPIGESGKRVKANG